MYKTLNGRGYIFIIFFVMELVLFVVLILELFK